MRSLSVATAPASEPITLEEAKLHLRVDTSDEDSLIVGLISAARDLLEGWKGRAFVTQTLDLWLDYWPDQIVLPRPPLVSVTSITVYDTADAATTLSASVYHVDTNSEPGRIVRAYGQSWPSTTLRPVHAIRIRYVAGYGAASAVPDKEKALMKLLISHLYEQREIVGDGGSELPFGIKAMMGERFTDTLVEC